MKRTHDNPHNGGQTNFLKTNGSNPEEISRQTNDLLSKHKKLVKQIQTRRKVMTAARVKKRLNGRKSQELRMRLK